MEYDQKYAMAMMLCFLFVLLVMPSSFAFVCGDYNIDCQALLKFKKGITSDPDGHLQSWNEANPFCNWTGVTCHQHLQNRVVALELMDMGLQGSMSPFVSNLSLLTKLQLQTNGLYGEIPSSFGDLSELAQLNLSSNKLQGNIPASLQGCQSLKLMDLSNNNLSGVIPQQIALMKSLTYLALSLNSFMGSISFLANLTEMIQLELGYNYFTGKIPPDLGGLKKLEIMYFHVNYLEGPMPAEISNCTALREISLIDNRLSGEIPTEMGLKLVNLQKLYLLMNKLSGKIPVTLSNLSQLILLDLSINKLEGEVPLELGRLKNLEVLYLHSNDLVSGSNNSSLSFLTALTNCSHLKKLHLASCLFTGKLPDSVGGLSKELYYFNIRDNSLAGNIPESIGNLSSLVTLNMWYNFLNGSLPASLGKLEQLQILNLGKNKISGPIPDDMVQMASLGSLNLSDNFISGSIPPSFCSLPQLRYLYLSHNRLSGKFPVELTRCSLLMLLDLSYNHFEGPVSPQIGNFRNLALSLNLSSNHFQGNIPETIQNLILLEEIDFSRNNFSGVIPSTIVRCISLKCLNFSNNILQGPIPESLKLITDLESLDLTHNQLNGTIPTWIGDNQMIKFLNLSYNRLSGEVPKTGRFSFFNRSSFLGNMGLCGGTAQMDLPPCEVQPHRHKTKKKLLYVILTVILGCMLLLWVAFIIWYLFLKQKYRKQDVMLTAVPNIHGTRTYTERELEVATAGFSEANLLGTGSFGSVYKAIMDDGRTTVAVKVLHEETVRSYKSLKRECEILSKIKHRNLVGMTGLTMNPQFKALVLEFIPNGNLEQHLYPGGLEEETCELTLKERLSIAIDVANGLEYLQEGCPTQVVHCDMKPQNVLLDNDMVAHITDFGIGKLLLDRPNDQASSTGFLRGSIGYIPPEYGQGSGVSVKGDTYSFGVVLLEMITRKRPTSSMFSGGLDLRKWVVSSFENDVLTVVDITLKRQASFGGSVGSVERLEQCCCRLLQVALSCTEENPQERPLMSSVVPMLLKVWKEMGF